MTLEAYVVNAFTDKAFKGNPAGVCILKHPLEETLMLQIAEELGYSETAFIIQSGNENEYSIRYFSPVMEIPLCGHATLASSKLVFDKHKHIVELKFFTHQNIELIVTKKANQIEMQFPVYSTIPKLAPIELVNALGLKNFINSEYNKETNILLIEIEDVNILRSQSPEYGPLKSSYQGFNGVLITAKSDKKEYDFESRYFWPWSGTLEDPVTGGTHTFLTPYWSKRLGKNKMQSFQCSKRTGSMEVEIIENVLFIRSNAFIVMKGELNL